MAMVKMKGFTLAELLIVIVILGILGGIALPRFYPQKEKALTAEAIVMLSAIRQGELAFQLENDGYKSLSSGDDWSVIGVESPSTDNPYFRYSTNADAATAERTGRGSPSVSGNITLSWNGTWSGDNPNKPSN